MKNERWNTEKKHKNYGHTELPHAGTERWEYGEEPEKP